MDIGLYPDNIPANLPGSSGETRDALADMAGVSGRTLERVERIERRGCRRSESWRKGR